MFDLIIRNGKIIDGTGGPEYIADVGIKDGVILRVGKGLNGAKEELDATGLVVTPGFIDSHSHSDNAMLSFPDVAEKIEQGITTAVCGQCGSSQAPLSRDADLSDPAEFPGFGKKVEVCRTMETFIGAAREGSFGSNAALFVGQGAIRRAVMGMDKREPTPEELEQMKALVRNAMESGAFGMSIGFYYPPGCYATTEEMIEVAKVVGEYHGVVSAHIRDEAEHLIRAVEEFITVVKAAGVRGVISHHKACKNRENWGKTEYSLKLIDQANEDGTEIYMDAYPYLASHTSLAATLVPDSGQRLKERLRDPAEREKMKEFGRARWGEDLSWVFVTSCDGYPEYIGKFLPEIAAIRGTDSYDAAYDIIEASKACGACYFTMCEEDVMRVLAHPRTMICTDSSVAGNSKAFHPRLKASFPRTLSHYVREKKIVSLPEMIRKMTSMPAAVYSLKKKGLVWEGMDADLCIFDPEKIRDMSRYDDPFPRCEGLHYVLVAGEVVVENAVFNGKRRGKVLLRP